jgi:hypothetical protein
MVLASDVLAGEGRTLETRPGLRELDQVTTSVAVICGWIVQMTG